MRKFEMNVPDAVLTDISRAILAADFSFIVTAIDADDEELVRIEVPYEKEHNDEISDLEDEINMIVETYYDEEEEREEEEEEEQEEEEEDDKRRRR